MMLNLLFCKMKLTVLQNGLNDYGRKDKKR